MLTIFLGGGHYEAHTLPYILYFLTSMVNNSYLFYWQYRCGSLKKPYYIALVEVISLAAFTRRNSLVHYCPIAALLSHLVCISATCIH